MGVSVSGPPIENGTDNGGHLARVNAHQDEGLLKERFIGGVDVPLPFEISPLPGKGAMAKVDFMLHLGQSATGGAKPARGTGAPRLIRGVVRRRRDGAPE